MYKVYIGKVSGYLRSIISITENGEAQRHIIQDDKSVISYQEYLKPDSYMNSKIWKYHGICSYEEFEDFKNNIQLLGGICDI